MLLILHNASRLPQLLSAFTALVFGFHLQRKGGGGGEGGGQGRKTTSMPHCNVSGGGGEGGWQENKTTPMVNCNVLWICAIVRFAIKIDGTGGTFIRPQMTSRDAPRIFILPKTTSREAPGKFVLPKTTARKTRETVVLAKTDVQ